jgi:hypothetical protein
MSASLAGETAARIGRCLSSLHTVSSRKDRPPLPRLGRVRRVPGVLDLLEVLVDVDPAATAERSPSPVFWKYWMPNETPSPFCGFDQAKAFSTAKP